MKLTGVTPNLITSDVDRSTVFYRDVLGFEVKASVPDQPPFVFVWLERDGVSIFLNAEAAARQESPDATWLTVGKSGVTMFIQMEGIGELWAQVQGRAPVAMPLKDQWYGMTEFSVMDPDGYLVTFAERRSGSS